MSKDNKEYLEKIKLSLSNTKINDISIAKELESSFMDYAMSVITARALPDVKDGLKPVHRRILYAAYNLAMVHDKPYKKSARLVGEVIGKFHPHGDSAVYEAIVRMAQDFSLRYPLIDGHGNFGSIDGDSAAAMRYTEARLSKIACEMLKDIEKDTINFNENYDGSEIEPAILPAAFPNLLANGSTGIAVGMSTVIPPHNLSELIDSAKFVANNRQCTIEEIMQYLKGPDFPTYAEIVGFSGIKNYFSTGKGTITVRCKYEIKQYENGKSAIIITQLPYMINKANLIEKIVRLVKDEIITGISDLRDESSREGIRIIIETKKDVIAEILLNKLFKSTDLQTNISVNIISLVNGVPTQLNIKDCLIYFIDHQLDVLLRKTNFELKKATAREHILEGLFIAVNNIDIIIKIIREASTNEQCESQLMVKFALTKEQTKAILDMRLRNLSNLEKERIEKELAEIRVLIKELSEIISNKAKQITIISQNLDEIKTKYGDERRSEILYNESSQIDDESLIPVEDIVITLSKKGYLKRMNADIYKTQNRGGVGVIGASTYEDDDVNNILTTTTHTDLLFFSDKGKVYRIRAHQIPNCSRQSKGMPALNLINIEKNEQILTILPINDYEEKFLFFVTVNGIVKKTMLREYSSIKANGKLAIILKENDLLQNVFITNGNDEIYLGTYKGKIIRFKETNVRPMGRTSSGVVGAKIEKEDDYIVGSSSSNNGKLLLTIGENGFGKISDVNKFRQTNRASRGVTALRINEKTGNMIFASAIYGDEDLFILTSAGKINRISLKTIRVIGRNTSGVKLINLANDVKIKSAAIFNNKEKNNENE